MIGKHPSEDAIEKALKELNVDIPAVKTVFEITGSGQIYDFDFCGTPTSVMLPLFIVNQNSNIVRYEFQIGCIPEGFQYQSLGIILNDLDMHRHSLRG